MGFTLIFSTLMLLLIILPVIIVFQPTIELGKYFIINLTPDIERLKHLFIGSALSVVILFIIFMMTLIHRVR